ncbi:potassium channel subfamily K member 17 [Terrapene carolina triunguis]|uniref:potassium channel subfamily K member 17 n=1 Tax=Terrapene triunguis TaxID=2587831 RepID=UPI000E7796A1|nr:potassium channel subfamily K member 17 [Terrapene carolina triunguis]
MCRAQGDAVAGRRWCRLPGTLLLLLAYVGYLLLGSTAFWALEGPAERHSAQQLLQDKWELLGNYTCLKGPALERLIQGIIKAYKSGLTLQGNATSLGRWDFVGSFFFSISAITTIGYGNLSPSTVSAQIFCIFFALFGIPLNLILLNRIGHLMLSGVQRCAKRLGEKLHWQEAATILTRTCALVTGLLLFLLLPPFLFSVIEGWTYEEGFYYSFVTLSTIGFGDYVIGMNPDLTYPSWYKNLVSVWILFGMAWLALVINLCITLLENSSDLCQCGKKKSKELEQELMDCNKNTSPRPDDVENCSSKDTKPEGAN